jgi:hypothetical protein
MKKVQNPGKKLDRLAIELGRTIKGMTPEQKRQYAGTITTNKHDPKPCLHPNPVMLIELGETYCYQWCPRCGSLQIQHPLLRKGWAKPDHHHRPSHPGKPRLSDLEIKEDTHE